MNRQDFSMPVELKHIQVTDAFWHREQELVRTQVLPYQWEALNDRVEGAAPSYCMRNFQVAGRMMREKRDRGAAYAAPVYTFRGFEALPEDPAHPDEDKFYGFVFQDTDFSKWIEAVAYSLMQHPDPALEKTADEAIDIVCAAQLENGYLDTYYIINGMDRAFTNLREHHELYCLGHLVEGAVAYYQATGKDKLLCAAERFADYCCQVFGPEPGQLKGYPGHEIAEMALVRLWEEDNQGKYLELAKFFLNQRGKQPYYFEQEEKERAAHDGQPYRNTTDNAYHQAHLPVREQSEAVGHAVRAMYLYSGMADVARECEDEALVAACERLWDNVTREKLYVTGGVGATHMGEAFSFNHDLPNDTAYSETCAAIGLVFWARRMLQLKPRGQYGDVMELALYNTVLAGMALDGKSFFYVNPLEVVPEACHRDARKFHVKSVRQKWFGCACCPPNIARLVGSVAAYAYTESDCCPAPRSQEGSSALENSAQEMPDRKAVDTLWIHLYMGSVLSKQVWVSDKLQEKKTLDIKVESQLPWEGKVQVSLRGDQVPCRLAFRIPSWSDGIKVSYRCGGREGQAVIDAQGLTVTAAANQSVQPEMVSYRDGYLYIEGTWQDGDEVNLEMEMPVRILEADPRVREDIGKVAIARGPIVYCLEEADNGKDLHLCRLDLQTLSPTDIQTETTQELGHPMTVLKVPGKRLIPSESGALYRAAQPVREEDVTLRMIPYYAWNNRGEGEMSVWVRR
ncbi:MAG: glycoside hydrolase family 127 protein [bacterium]|nr:glycoside hydrolase family 127 protein [bacterium]MCM1373900.1 glycoside hydrolase family 127 protein [Muribaculum sp.]